MMRNIDNRNRERQERANRDLLANRSRESRHAATHGAERDPETGRYTTFVPGAHVSEQPLSCVCGVTVFCTVVFIVAIVAILRSAPSDDDYDY